MKRTPAYLVPLLLSLAMAGCNHPEDHPAAAPAAAPANPVAIVDLEGIAKGVGWEQQLTTNMAALKSQFDDSLSKTKTSFEDQVKQAHDRVANGVPDAQLSEQQKQVLVQVANNAQQGFNQLQSEANRRYEGYRADCAKQYRDAIAPIIREVAADRKISMVVAKTESVLYNDGAIDITDAVVDSARAHMPTVYEVPKPKLPEPGPLFTITNTTQPSMGVNPATTRP